MIIVFGIATNILSQVEFTTHTIATDVDGGESVYAVDVDGDGDMDVLSTSTFDDKIAWYENLLIVGIVNNDLPIVPDKLLLYNNYPNPYNPSTTIKYQIPEMSFIKLKVYDVLGNGIATLVNEEKPAGSYEVKFDATGLPSGIYLYSLRTGNNFSVKKMILLK